MRQLKIQSLAEKGLIEAAVKILAAGGLIIYPTETVYGLGVDATNPAAVQKLLTYKTRREGKPLSIAVANQAMAEKYVEVNEQAQSLYDRFLPGPMTVISNVVESAKNLIAPGVASEFGTLGIRIPDHDLILKIVAAFGKPITATSANASGKKRPYTIQDIFGHLSQRQKNLVDLVLDAGRLPPNQPSTVIDTTLSTPITLRTGSGAKKTAIQATKAGLLKPKPAAILESVSPADTQKLAGRLLLKHWDDLKKQGLVIGLNGPLGIGKTIFTKGVAQFLQITDTITSPTYSYMNEYDFERHGIKGQLIHLDAWRIDQALTWQQLQVKKLLRPGNAVVIEWWDQIEKFASKQVRKQKMKFLKIDLREIKARQRQLTVWEE